jgi:hypothetical protein
MRKNFVFGAILLALFVAGVLVIVQTVNAQSTPSKRNDIFKVAGHQECVPDGTTHIANVYSPYMLDVKSGIPFVDANGVSICRQEEWVADSCGNNVRLLSWGVSNLHPCP